MKSLRMTAWPVLATLGLAAVGVAFNLSPSTSSPGTLTAIAADSDTLIPRKAIFGNPSRTSAQVSPDGKWISFIAPRDGVLNVWVAPYGKVDEAKPVTASTERPIRQHFWAADSSRVVYLNDRGGDENFRLYSVDPATGAEIALTPFENTRVFVFGTSWENRTFF